MMKSHFGNNAKAFKMKFEYRIFFFLIFCLPFIASAQSEKFHRTIKWQDIQEIQINDDESLFRLKFENASFKNREMLPEFLEKIRFENDVISFSAIIENAVFKNLTQKEIFHIQDIFDIEENITINSNLAYSRKKPVGIISFLPFRLDPENGKYQKLLSFDLIINISHDSSKSGQAALNYAAHSVLSGGDWYKIRLNRSGIYKITYSDLAGMGMDVNSINPENIRIYGNGGGMLPESNSEFRYDDLQENAIIVHDGGDGNFNEGDYILFYGESPNAWKLKPEISRFYHYKNVYSDSTYYFITADIGPGKRIEMESSSTEEPNYSVTTFNDFEFHEQDLYNLIKSGREWYGEVFDLQTSYDFSFNFPNLKNDEEHYIRVKVVARASASSSFSITNDGAPLISILVPGVSIKGTGDYARTATGTKFFNTTGPDVNIGIKYNKSTSSASGWLDYIELNIIRNMIFSGGQMDFRDAFSIGSDRISEFKLSGVSQSVKVWEITDPVNIHKVETSLAGSNLTFVLPTNELREFIAYDGSSYLTADFAGKIPNQDLHSLGQIDYVIVSHPEFLSQANRLESFHTSNSKLKIHVTTPGEIYNEFSSGAQDITAIKDLMRMLYERAEPGQEPKYLLLFGDASYDYKNRIADNTNFVPTFESEESLHETTSYATDDYFGFLDPDEGKGKEDLLDIGIGRFVVQTLDEASQMVDKVFNYAGSSVSIMGDWRNVITFVADDENGNVHMNQANQLAQFVDTTYKTMNVDKIYIDAYNQVSTPGGQRYPDVNKAINTRIGKGTLIMNYTGHGGEVGWAHERILEISDINSWENFNSLTVFVTATCEFTRYDDPGRISAGELVFINPHGGGISLFTTSRPTYGSSNLSLNRGFYKYAFEKQDNGEYYSMGDLIRLAKFESSSESNDKKFILIGDPALKISYPEYKVETVSINQHNVSPVPDTLKALSKVTLSGEIQDETGNKLNDFDGAVSTIVYDKESEVTTFGHDPGSSQSTFMLRKNVIYKGKANVTGGEFSLSFIVPKDIAYQYGFGKISYYANNDKSDASGYSENIIVGGFSDTEIVDVSGPSIELFMNNESFKSGGITDENPVLLAHVSDSNGINTVGNGIGHDIVAILDDDTENPFILNDYYEADMNSYKSGKILYPLSGISPGSHRIELKIWDVFNNSSKSFIDFIVEESSRMTINNVINYPNPFCDYTSFVFDHNQPGSELDVEIKIFDISGRLVANFNERINNNGYKATPIIWYGTNINGANLDGGIYIYRIRVSGDDGKLSHAVKKLVISR